MCQPLPTRPGLGQTGGTVAPDAVLPGPIVRLNIRALPGIRGWRRGLGGQDAGDGVASQAGGGSGLGVPGAQLAMALRQGLLGAGTARFSLKTSLRGRNKAPI